MMFKAGRFAGKSLWKIPRSYLENALKMCHLSSEYRDAIAKVLYCRWYYPKKLKREKGGPRAERRRARKAQERQESTI